MIPDRRAQHHDCLPVKQDQGVLRQVFRTREAEPVEGFGQASVFRQSGSDTPLIQPHFDAIEYVVINPEIIVAAIDPRSRLAGEHREKFVVTIHLKDRRVVALDVKTEIEAHRWFHSLTNMTATPVGAAVQEMELFARSRKAFGWSGRYLSIAFYTSSTNGACSDSNFKCNG